MFGIGPRVLDIIDDRTTGFNDRIINEEYIIDASQQQPTESKTLIVRLVEEHGYRKTSDSRWYLISDDES